MADKQGLTEAQAYPIRHLHQKLWYDTGRELREKDPGVLVRIALKHGPVIAGVRDKEEIEYAVRGRSVDRILWIDRPWCQDSMLKFTKEDCYSICEEHGWQVRFGIIDNSKSLFALHRELTSFCQANAIPIKERKKRSASTAVKPLPQEP